MKKLSKGKLFQILVEWRNISKIECANLWTKEDDQAFEQIKEMLNENINKKPEKSK